MKRGLRLGVLASGNGTNLQAILDATRAGRLDARVACVISDRPGARALDRAARAGVPHYAMPRAAYGNREEHDAALVAQLLRHEVELVVLAGYLRLVGSPFLDTFPGRMLNVHPSLLPAFPGLDAQRQAWEYGVKVTGCTVHFVDQGLDTGPIILQESIQVDESGSLEEMTERLHAIEHRLLTRAIALIARGSVHIEGRKVVVRDQEMPSSK